MDGPRVTLELKDGAEPSVDVARVRRLLERLELGLDPEAAPEPSEPLDTDRTPRIARAQTESTTGKSLIVPPPAEVETRAPPTRSYRAIVAFAAIIGVVGIGGSLFWMHGLPVDATREPDTVEASQPPPPRNRSSALDGATSTTTAEALRDAIPLASRDPQTAPPPNRTVSTDPATGARLPAAPAGRPSPSHEEVIAAAGGALAEGRVQKARQLLEQHLAESPQNADLVWALARAHSPIVLSELPSRDAEADEREAERLFQRWYDIALQQGLVSPDVSLERILVSMRLNRSR
ncbi:MAG: tetratricopeptide repeat protein [Hyphomicrobiaceae bacterium]